MVRLVIKPGIHSMSMTGINQSPEQAGNQLTMYGTLEAFLEPLAGINCFIVSEISVRFRGMAAIGGAADTLTRLAWEVPVHGLTQDSRLLNLTLHDFLGLDNYYVGPLRSLTSNEGKRPLFPSALNHD